MNIGFIGLGVMGRPMAANLLAAGHSLLVSRLKPASQFLVDQGARAAETPRDLAEQSDVIILMLPDTPQVEEVLFGESGVSEGLRAGSLVIDMSSISPVATKDFAARIAQKQAAYVDAPVSGGELGAKNASLTIMVGGGEADFERARPLFEAMGKPTLVGDVGSGQTAKVANQIIVGLTIEAVAEALTFARKAGADPSRVREALLGGFAISRILEVHGQRMIDGTFEPGFRMQLHRKDLNLALEAARALDMALPNTASTAQLMNLAVGMGNADKDHSALSRTLEYLANIDRTWDVERASSEKGATERAVV